MFNAQVSRNEAKSCKYQGPVFAVVCVLTNIFNLPVPSHIIYHDWNSEFKNKVLIPDYNEWQMFSHKVLMSGEGRKGKEGTPVMVGGRGGEAGVCLSWLGEGGQWKRWEDPCPGLGEWEVKGKEGYPCFDPGRERRGTERWVPSPCLGYPPPLPCGQTDICENITSLSFRCGL